MNLAELPMILFTVIAQMCVGAFVVLGLMDLTLGLRHPRAAVARITEPVVYAIGPLLVLGLVASMFHMNDVTHVLNVLRHVDSSWLSREIWFGIGFAALGFGYALLQWFRLGSELLRRIVAGLAALVGLGLVWSMSMIYASLRAVPAWHTPIVPIQFFATTLLLGSLAVACALMLTALVRRRAGLRAAAAAVDEALDDGAPGLDAGSPDDVPAATPDGGGSVGLLERVKVRARAINAPTSTLDWSLTTAVIRRALVLAAIAGAVILVSYPVHIANLAAGDAVAQASAAHFSGALFIVRLTLLALSTMLIGLVAYRAAGLALRDNPRLLGVLVVSAFALALIGEFLGRALHYESMIRIGI